MNELSGQKISLKLGLGRSISIFVFISNHSLETHRKLYRVRTRAFGLLPAEDYSIPRPFPPQSVYPSLVHPREVSHTVTGCSLVMLLRSFRSLESSVPRLFSPQARQEKFDLVCKGSKIYL